MANNLLDIAWLPVVHQQGQTRKIAPWQITEQHAENPIVRLDAPRADFNGALMQFLIGLLQTACASDDRATWKQWIEKPPSPQRLQEDFQTIAHAFEREGDGPCFMQDIEELGDKYTGIDGLLIESPGGNTLKNNADLFIKRGHIEGLCPDCAITALFTMQINAPSGGVGHRTSLRGGGPLTTLVVLDPKENKGLNDTLWRNLWLNVLEKPVIDELTHNPHKHTEADIFPWLAPTRTSEPKTGCDTPPEAVHPLQMYWNMPRRIRLDWEHTATGHCDICGQASDKLVQHYVTRNYGVNYTGAWQHPLTPYRFDKEQQPIALHPQPGGLTYRYWLSLAEESEGHALARVVREYKIKKTADMQMRLWAFGYDMDNMKARAWQEAHFPLLVVSEEVRAHFVEQAEAMVNAATDAAGSVRSCIMEAWFKRPKDVSGDSTFLREMFFQHTEVRFFNMLDRLRDVMEKQEDKTSVLQSWHKILLNEALALFDYWTGNGDFRYQDPRKIARARKKLRNYLYSKKMREWLHLPKVRTRKENAA